MNVFQNGSQLEDIWLNELEVFLTSLRCMVLTMALLLMNNAVFVCFLSPWQMLLKLKGPGSIPGKASTMGKWFLTR